MHSKTTDGFLERQVCINDVSYFVPKAIRCQTGHEYPMQLSSNAWAKVYEDNRFMLPLTGACEFVESEIHNEAIITNMRTENLL